MLADLHEAELVCVACFFVLWVMQKFDTGSFRVRGKGCLSRAAILHHVQQSHRTNREIQVIKLISF